MFSWRMKELKLVWVKYVGSVRAHRRAGCVREGHVHTLSVQTQAQAQT
jgi:hypothetical protein